MPFYILRYYFCCCKISYFSYFNLQFDMILIFFQTANVSDEGISAHTGTIDGFNCIKGVPGAYRKVAACNCTVVH